MVLSDNEILASLGVKLADPFDWGDESQIMTIDDVKKPTHPSDPGAPLSGLDSIKKFVLQKNNGQDNDSEKNILQSLFKDAKVDLSTASVPMAASIPADKDQVVLTEDSLRDVSIKGLSDRAVAELTVESRTSLFGSILRLFDKPRDGENPDAVSGGGNSKKKNSDEIKKGASGASNSKEVISANANAMASVAAIAGAGEGVTDSMIIKDSMIMKEPILSTAEIVRSVHLTARPGDIPAGMDSKEYTMAVLHFLASYVPYLHEDEKEYMIDSNKESREGWDQLRKTLPVLPLIKATNPGESLELRCYGRVMPLIKLGQKEKGGRKQYPDSIDRDEAFRMKVLNLERIYSSSLPFSPTFASARLSSKLASSSNSQSLSKATATTQRKGTTQQKRSGNDLPFAFQRYVPRRKLVPHIEGGAKEELTLMISGHMQQPQHTPGPKPKTAKSKTTAASGLKATTSTVKSSSSAGNTNNTSTGKEKAGADSYLTPSKRKGDTSTGSLLPQSKKKKEVVLHESKKGKQYEI